MEKTGGKSCCKLDGIGCTSGLSRRLKSDTERLLEGVDDKGVDGSKDGTGASPGTRRSRRAEQVGEDHIHKQRFVCVEQESLGESAGVLRVVSRGGYEHLYINDGER